MGQGKGGGHWCFTPKQKLSYITAKHPASPVSRWYMQKNNSWRDEMWTQGNQSLLYVTGANRCAHVGQGHGDERERKCQSCGTNPPHDKITKIDILLSLRKDFFVKTDLLVNYTRKLSLLARGIWRLISRVMRRTANNGCDERPGVVVRKGKCCEVNIGKSKTSNKSP